ncbi:unnamed protein product [Rhodiola kirilowii]
MFGRVRPATCSVDSLERTPSKIVKDHSFSVFDTENTLVKFKLGSKRQLDSVCDQSKADDDERSVYAHCPQFTCSATEELVLAHEDSAPEAAIKDSCKPMSSSNNNVSVVYMFSKYRSSQKYLITPCDL